MRTVIQRVTKASVTVGDELISSIGRGICILVGISKDDTPKEREYIVRKILNLRLFDDENDKRWAKSVRDKQLEILCVSQFTLYSILKGNKPDFHQAMPGDQSQTYYNEFLDMLRKDYNPDKIKDGQFGAHMQVHIQNDGPVTIQLDSPPDSGVSTGQESAGNTDLLWHSRQSGTKTPVAVVKAQPKDKKVEKATKYVSNFTETFQDQPDTQIQFIDTINKGTQGSISVAEMMLSVTGLLSGQRELLCSFTGFLPPGHTVGIQNNDPTQVIVRIPGQRSALNRQELTQFVDSIRSNSASAVPEEQRAPSDMTAGLSELISQFEKLSTTQS